MTAKAGDVTTSATQKLVRIQASKLFGYLDQDIRLKDEGITILHGANGSGKTTILRCISDVSSGKWSSLAERPIAKLALDFEGGNRFEFNRGPEEITYTYKRRGKKAESWSVPTSAMERFKSYGGKTTFALEDYWEYTRHWKRAKAHPSQITEFYYTADMWPHVSNEFADLAPPPDWLVDFKSQFSSILIEEQRLLKFATDQDKKLKATRTVSDFSTNIADAIKEVSREYGVSSQQLDRTFPMRLVKVLNDQPPDVRTIQEKYAQLERRRKELEAADLIGSEASIIQLDTSSLDRTEVRRLLYLYAVDIENKLSLFDTIYKKISLFENLVKDYFSRKEATISKKGIAIRSTVTGQPLDAEALSSGEQHIFVLFFRLIFLYSGSHLVLIDEPELSLHPRWQLRFVDDLERIRKVTPMDFVLASHSPQIFQGHMHLGQDLNI